MEEGILSGQWFLFKLLAFECGGRSVDAIIAVQWVMEKF